jgi:hypothetical protein
MAGDSSIRLGSARPLVSQGVTRPSLRARTVARGLDPDRTRLGQDEVPHVRDAGDRQCQAGAYLSNAVVSAYIGSARLSPPMIRTIRLIAT